MNPSVVGVVLSLVVFLGGPAAPASAQARDPISPELRATMAAAAPDQQIAAYLVMSDQLQLSDFDDLGRGGSRARRRAVADRLRLHAAATQGPVRSRFDAFVADGRARLVTDLWMGNALVFTAEPGVIAELAGLAGIDRIRLDVDQGAAAYQDVGPAPAAPPAPVAATAAYPFEDDFESGVLQPHWIVQTTGNGYAAVSGAQLPIGNFHVLMASSVDNVDSTASITVVLDLTGETDVGLSFSHKEFNDENHAEDGVFISDDGVTWHTAVSLQNTSNSYQTHNVELDPLVSGFGMSYTSNFHVRFQWSDNYDIPTDGFAFDEIVIAEGAGAPGPAVPEPNIVALQAPDLWAMGYDGTGILLGNIDSGTTWTHPDLIDHVWNNPVETGGTAGVDDDSNGFIDDFHGWDFLGNNNNVTSGDSHGTMTAGIAVGDGTSGRGTGMAPGATFVVGEISGETNYWAAQQYMLDVGVDVITSSYSYKWPAPRPDYHMHRQMCAMELAAGIIHANSIGNQGGLSSYPIPFNISAPGNCPAPFRHPDQEVGGETSVMGCGGITLPSDAPYSSSGRGPSAWEDIKLYDAAYPHAQDPDWWDYPRGGFGGVSPGLVKPDVVTYTVNIQTTASPTGYGTFGGTSAATPHLGGAMCLLRQVQPAAEPRHIAAALMLTAVDLGAAGKDNQFGAGKIQVKAAARRLVMLGKFDDQAPSLGSTVTLDLFGPPNQFVYAFLGFGIVDNASDWNLGVPFLFLAPYVLDGTGTFSTDFVVPNNTNIVGVDFYTAFAYESTGGPWGAGPIVSVPERLTPAP